MCVCVCLACICTLQSFIRISRTASPVCAEKKEKKKKKTRKIRLRHVLRIGRSQHGLAGSALVKGRHLKEAKLRQSLIGSGFPCSVDPIFNNPKGQAELSEAWYPPWVRFNKKPKRNQPSLGFPHSETDPYGAQTIQADVLCPGMVFQSSLLLSLAAWMTRKGRTGLPGRTIAVANKILPNHPGSEGTCPPPPSEPKGICN